MISFLTSLAKEDFSFQPEYVHQVLENITVEYVLPRMREIETTIRVASSHVYVKDKLLNA